MQTPGQPRDNTSARAGEEEAGCSRPSCAQGPLPDPRLKLSVSLYPHFFLQLHSKPSALHVWNASQAKLCPWGRLQGTGWSLALNDLGKDCFIYKMGIAITPAVLSQGS